MANVIVAAIVVDDVYYTCTTCRFRKISVAIAEEEFKSSTIAVAPALPVKEAIQEPRNVRVMYCC